MTDYIDKLCKLKCNWLSCDLPKHKRLFDTHYSNVNFTQKLVRTDWIIDMKSPVYYYTLSDYANNPNVTFWMHTKLGTQAEWFMTRCPQIILIDRFLQFIFFFIQNHWKIQEFTLFQILNDRKILLLNFQTVYTIKIKYDQKQR